MRIFLYLASIVIANVITARFAPLELGVLSIPWGTYLVGCTFILRDLVQRRYGKLKTYYTISAALILSAITSALLGDSLAIVFASALSFLISEAADTEVFSRLKKSFATKVLVSGLIGGTLDSVIFGVVGLGPWGAGFLTWELVPTAILGQFIVKALLQALGAVILIMFFKKHFK